MKKYLYLLALIVATIALQAQNRDLYSLMYNEMTGYYFAPQCLMQQRDGDLILNIRISEDDGIQEHPLGNVTYKMSSESISIVDSLFVIDTTMASTYYWDYFSKDSDGEGNIKARLEYHEDSDSTFLRISHFSDTDLHIDLDEDDVVPLCDSLAYGGVCLLDHCNDFLITYYKKRSDGRPLPRYDAYGVRIGLDGTLKCQALLAENIPEWEMYYQFRELKESPPKYYQWHTVNVSYYNHAINNVCVVTIDSVFRQNTIVLSSGLSVEFLNPPYDYPAAFEYIFLDGDTEVIPVEEDDILVAAQYVNDTDFLYNSAEYGVAVVKYDLRTMQMKDYVVFNDFSGCYNDARCLGLKMMSDGTLYFLYKERGYPSESVIVVKMDTNLNVEWKRFLKTQDVVISSPLAYSVLCENEQGAEVGIAWGGYGTKTGTNNYGLLCFYLNHDGTVGVNENNIEVRPYLFYPNPAQDRLHLQFSPDVKPTQVELYDLQGRLVRTQGDAFDSLDLGMLPAGTYTLRITMEDGQVFSDKVVKE